MVGRVEKNIKPIEEIRAMETRSLASERDKKLLEAFALISSGKSFRAAAKELGISKSTLSR